MSPIEKCPGCQGNKTIICPLCNGARTVTKKVPVTQPGALLNFDTTSKVECPTCHGIGKLVCELCHGVGLVDTGKPKTGW